MIVRKHVKGKTNVITSLSRISDWRTRLKMDIAISTRTAKQPVLDDDGFRLEKNSPYTKEPPRMPLRVMFFRSSKRLMKPMLDGTSSDNR